MEERVTIIPIELPFLRVLADTMSRRFAALIPDFSSVLMVFPTQRNKLYFRRYMLDSFPTHAFIPPTMKTIDELMNYVYELQGGRPGIRLNSIERNFVLKTVVDSLKVEFWQDIPFLKFVAIGNRLLAFFDELAKERITLDAVEEAVLKGHYPEKYVQNELPIIKRIYTAYRKRIREQGYSDEIDMYDAIYSGFSPALLKDYEHICIAGLAATTVTENTIILNILENLPAELVIHSHVHSMQMTTTDTPFHVHNRLLRALGFQEGDNLKVHGDAEVMGPVVHIKRTETLSQQTLYLGGLLKKVKGRYDPHRMAIILTDTSLVYSIVETLTTAGLEFNLSAGFPCTHSILYSFLNQLKNVVQTNAHFKEFIAFIRHPLFKNAIVNGTPLRPLIYELEQTMIEQRFNYFQKEQYATDNLMPLVRMVEMCMSTACLPATLSDYIQRLVEMLNAILSYNEEMIRKNMPGVREFIDHLNHLAQLRITHGLEQGPEMLDFILTILADETYTVQGDPLKGVQVLGILEARNLDFDCVILPSMNEGIFPRRSEKDLFISQAARKNIGLPYDKLRENLFYYYFTELTHGKKEVYLCYVEEEKRDIRSRFIDFLIDEGITVDETKILLDHAALIVPSRNVKKDSSLMHVLVQKLAQRGLAPTNLKDYRECPYRFYLKYLLGISEPAEIVEEAGALEWGSILHGALCNFYRYDFPRGLRERDIDRALPMLYERLRTALKDTLALKPTQVNYLDLELYKRIMRTFLEVDSKRFASGFSVVTEKLEKSVSSTMDIANTRIKFFGFPDRVDIRDNDYFVIDYKTKIPKTKEYTIGEDFAEYQLPLYGLILERENAHTIGGLAYYELSGEVTLKPVVEEDAVGQYLHDFKKMILIPTVEEMLNTTSPFYQTDDPDACKYCAYSHLCGV